MPYTAGFNLIATLTPDLDRYVAAFGAEVALGADIGEIHQLGDIWSLFFRDCDGRELEVCCASDDR